MRSFLTRLFGRLDLFRRCTTLRFARFRFMELNNDEIRRYSRHVVSFGDCAVTGNVTAMRNPIAVEEVLKRSYVELADVNPGIPRSYPTIAELMRTARPLHEVIPVDAFIHGCPPTADQIWSAVCELLEGRMPVLSHVFLRYG